MFCRYHEAFCRLTRSAPRPALAAAVATRAASTSSKTSASTASVLASPRRIGRPPKTSEFDAGEEKAPRKRRKKKEEVVTDEASVEVEKPERTGKPTAKAKAEMTPEKVEKPNNPRKPRATKNNVAAEGNDLVAKFQAAAPWRSTNPKKRPSRLPASVLDYRRVHVASEELCDEVIKYMDSSLDRHVGCDLIDLNPGIGLWSRKLHDRLQPRKHIMMEADAALYSPCLASLTAQPNVELIPESGIVWKDLTAMLESRLEHQVPVSSPFDPSAQRRNDTLLVTANLTSAPTRTLYGFDSLSMMVLHQFISSIPTSSLFQRYGRVRMLIWSNDEDKRRVLPRTLSRRRRFAFTGELFCDWIHELVGLDNADLDTNYLRDEWLNLESAYATLGRMQSANISMPPGREPFLHKQALADPSLLNTPLAGRNPHLVRRPYLSELEAYRTDVSPLDLTDNADRLTRKRALFLASRERADSTRADLWQSLLEDRDAIHAAAASGSTTDPAFLSAAASWTDRVAGLKKNDHNLLVNIRDNYHLFRQSPPAMLWDRRAFEPLICKPSDFFPHAPCTLLDIQPKALHPLLQQHGPGSTRSGDVSDVLLRAWFSNLTTPAPAVMHALWPGFGESYASCPSFTDPARGGSPISGPHGTLTARSINEQQWLEVVQAWMDWPFRPEYKLFLGRMLDDGDGHEDEEGNAVGSFDGDA